VRIVSFGLAVPYEGVPHAGGEYYLRHVQALLERGHEVIVIVPASPENDATAALAPAGLSVHVVQPLGLPVRDRIDRLRSRLLPIRPPVGFMEAVRRDGVVAEALRRADVVELQWTQIVAAHPAIRVLVPPTAVVVGVAHDVVSQGFARRADRSSVGHAVRRRLRAWQARRAEPRLLSAAAAVLTFSGKDADLLRRLGVQARIEVVPPPIASVSEDRLPPVRAGRAVLFVGAFNRPENTSGALWLIDEVWPLVLARRPDALLEIVGAHPGAALHERAAVEPTLTVTGYVDDLSGHYRGATVAVVPLLLGAGVKFKTVVAMTWGLPVVATTVGVEGVLDGRDGGELGVSVADDPARFASAVVAVLDDPPAAAERAARGRRFALGAFGTDGFADRLDALYRDLRHSSVP
jgi:glycosyltransferase involved in cell wall biosynthesis